MLLRRATVTTLPALLLLACTGLGGSRSDTVDSVGRPQATAPLDLHAVPVQSSHGMVVCNSPEAARVGAEILEAGGNAVDAAVAAAFALGVAEPGASGLGGQANILIRMAGGRAVAIDGSSFVPRNPDLEGLRAIDALGQDWGAPTIAVPTAPAALALALDRHGTMTLKRVLAPAIVLAEHGVTMAPTQRAFLESYLDAVSESDFLRTTFLRHGFELHDPDHVFCQPQMGRTLRQLAASGIASFYRGELAALIEQDMIASGAAVRQEDLARVRPVERMPAIGSYRNLEILAFPRPGGGGAVTGALATIQEFSPQLLRSQSADTAHLLAEAVRLAQVDALFTRSFRGVPAFPGPIGLPRRASQIRFDRALTRREIIDQLEYEFWTGTATTHLSVIDRDGNAVAATLSLGKNFGASVAGAELGILWNSFLGVADRPRYQGTRRPEPGEPIRGLMAPTIVLKDGKPFLILGSQGSGRITGSIVQTIVNIVDLGLSLPDAVTRPRVVWDGVIDGTIYIEMAPPNDENLAKTLHERGFENIYRLRFPARPIDLAALGGVNAIMVDPETGEFIGIGDPRRYAAARAPEPANMRSPAK